MTQPDYYQILGVDRSADAKTIKEAYRSLAFRYHPDRNEAQSHTADQTAEKMKEVNEAYAVLSHPEKREAYDTMRHRFGDRAYDQFRTAYSQQDIFTGSDVHQIFEEMARSFNLRGGDEMFRQFYGPGYARFQYRRHAGPGGGRGVGGGWQRQKRVLGMGRLVQTLLRKVMAMALPTMGEDLHDTIRLNPELAQAGGPYAYYHRQRQKRLVVTIPSQTRQGQKIRLTSMGAAGKNGGGPGDLYLKVKIRRPWYEKIKELIVSTFGR